MKSVFSAATAILLLGSSLTWAECERAEAPGIPDGSTASEQEMIDLRPPLTRKLVLGPGIQIKKPSTQDTDGGDTIVTLTPMNLLVEFVETIAPVDMESLEVKVKKGWFSKSLTDKLKPYVKGTTIEANDLKVPEGRYLIEFSVADSNDTETKATYGLKVIRQ